MSSSILRGTGTAISSVEVQSGATLFPGATGETSSGKLTVNGNVSFDSGAFFQVAGFGKTSDSLQVNGNLVIGSNVQVLLQGVFLPGVKYDLIDVTGTLTGRFNPTETLANGLLTATLQYGADPFVFIVPQANFVGLAQTPNQAAVAAALSNAANAGSTAPLITALLNSVSPATAPAAFDALSGEGITGQQETALSAGNLFVTTVLGQATYFGDDRANDIFGLKDGVPACSLKDGYACAIASRARLWAAGFTQQASVDAQAASGAAAQSHSGSGVATGMDYEVTRSLLLGIAGGYSSSSFSDSARATTGTVEGGHFAVYGRESYGAFYVAGAVEYAHYNNTSDRIVTALGAPEEERGRFGSNEWLSRVEAGYRTGYGDVTFTPFAGFQVASLSNAGFTEFSTGVAGLSVAGQTVDSDRSFLGVQFDGKLVSPEGFVVSPYLRLSWEHEFASTARSLTASFEQLSGASFTVFGPAAASDLGRLSAGFKFNLSADVIAFANFDGELSNRGSAAAGTGGIKIRF